MKIWVKFSSRTFFATCAKKEHSKVILYCSVACTNKRRPYRRSDVKFHEIQYFNTHLEIYGHSKNI